MIIADDEDIIREGLRDCIDWESLDIRIVGEASSGREALRRVRECRPDILLTDIVMPGMSGIQLAEEVRRERRDMRIVMISAYQDLQYMKSAFKYDVSDYILKPFCNDELMQVMRKVTARLQEERAARRRMAELQGMLEESLTAVRERFLQGLLRTPGTDEDSIFEKLERYRVGLPRTGIYIAAVLHAEAEGGEPGGAALRILQELSREFAVCWTADDPRQYAAILCVKQAAGAAERVRRAMLRAIQLHGGAARAVSAGIGRPVPLLGRIRESYLEAKQALNRSVLEGGGEIFVYDDVSPDRRGCPPDLLKAADDIADAFDNGPFEAVEEASGNFFLLLKEHRIYEPHAVHGLVLDMFRHLFRRLSARVSRGQLERMMMRAGGMPPQPNLSAYRDLTAKWLKEFYDEVRSRPAGREEKIVRALIEAMKRRLDKEWTLQQLAEEANLSVSHMSYLFKKVTGETPLEHLIRLRMERAKAMLDSDAVKIYEVAEATGYRDPNYFSKLFKKYYGVTPKEYRYRTS